MGDFVKRSQPGWRNLPRGMATNQVEDDSTAGSPIPVRCIEETPGQDLVDSTAFLPPGRPGRRDPQVATRDNKPWG